MIPNDILNALLESKEVKVNEGVFNYICDDEEYKPTNCFTIYQIEQGLVNLYNELTGKCYHDILFEDISIF